MGKPEGKATLVTGVFADAGVEPHTPFVPEPVFKLGPKVFTSKAPHKHGNARTQLAFFKSCRFAVSASTDLVIRMLAR